ncbi:MAG: hypothetical protein ACRDFX_01615 [Chloroflexota bacterium]
MTDNTTPKAHYWSSQAPDLPPEVAAAWAHELAMQIGIIQVRLLGLEPGQSEIEWSLVPTGPLGAGSTPAGYPAYQKEAYIAAYRLFIRCVKRELDLTFADAYLGW